MVQGLEIGCGELVDIAVHAFILEQVRRKRYATSNAESEEDVTSLAMAPTRSSRHLMALNISVPASHKPGNQGSWQFVPEMPQFAVLRRTQPDVGPPGRSL